MIQTIYQPSGGSDRRKIGGCVCCGSIHIWDILGPPVCPVCHNSTVIGYPYFSAEGQELKQYADKAIELEKKHLAELFQIKETPPFKAVQ
jgi:hypothetical protein